MAQEQEQAEGRAAAKTAKTPAGRSRRPGRPRRSAADRVRDADFAVVFRGYERTAVDRYVATVAEIVAELEATQLRETVVQRALDEVGEQTSGVLQRAHETAEEITAHSRAQADGRLQHAERDAEAIRREADEYAQRVEAEIARLRDDRLRLIEELRRLADEVLGVADDALERLPEEEEEGKEEETESPEHAPTRPEGDGGHPTVEIPTPGDEAGPDRD
jgi:hypothetical protein